MSWLQERRQSSQARGRVLDTIKILDINKKEVADGEVGELFSKMSCVFDGYLKSPKTTAQAFCGRWCSVGAMARRDADGYIHLVDCKGNLIISCGENIYPSKVEGVLGAHPRVKEATGKILQRCVSNL